MESLKQHVMTEGYGGRLRSISFRVTKVLKTTNSITREVESFVCDQDRVISIIDQIKDYFGSAYLINQLIGNKIRVMVSNPESEHPEVFEFFVEKVINEKIDLKTELYRSSYGRNYNV